MVLKCTGLASLAILFFTSHLTVALPTHAESATIIKRQAVQASYDYVIIGGGTSGLTVGDRLTEDGKCEQYHNYDLI